MDLGGTKMAVAVADLSGHRLARTVVPTGAGAGSAEVMARMSDAGHALLAETGVGVESVGAAAAVTPGVVLRHGVLLAPNNDGWESLALAQELQQAFGTPLVVVDNDVKAAARAEARWGRLAGVGTGIYLNLGTGFGCATVVAGEVHRGAHGAAGEFGYQLTGRSTDRPFADGGAPLEELAGGRAISERASALAGRHLTTAEAFAHWGADGPIGRLLADALDVLGRHVANLAVAIDPEVIVVAGGMTGSAEVILPVLRRYLDQAVPYPPGLELARLGAEGALTGAVLMALEAAAEPAPAGRPG